MTLSVRIIPCLDVTDGRVVKGVNFTDLVDAGDPAHGVKNVTAHLKARLGPETKVRKGTTMNEFFRGTQYIRRGGERVSDWLTRFDEGIDHLREDGVDISKVADLVG